MLEHYLDNNFRTFLNFEEDKSRAVEVERKKWEAEKSEIIKEYQDEVDALKSNLYSKED